MKIKKSLGSLTTATTTTCVVLLIMMTTQQQVDGLSEYCSTINQKELYEKLKTCYTPTDSSSSTVTSPPASTTSYTVASGGGNRVTGQSTASLPSYFQTQLSQVSEFHFYFRFIKFMKKKQDLVCV